MKTDSLIPFLRAGFLRMQLVMRRTKVILSRLHDGRICRLQPLLVG